MDFALFKANHSGRHVKAIVLRCLAQLIDVSHHLVGSQTGNSHDAYQAFRNACALLESVNGWIRCDGYWSLPVGEEAFLTTTIAAIETLKGYVQGSDAAARATRDAIECVAIMLADLHGHIRTERQRLERLRPAAGAGEPRAPGSGGGDGPR